MSLYYMGMDDASSISPLSNLSSGLSHYASVLGTQPTHTHTHRQTNRIKRSLEFPCRPFDDVFGAVAFRQRAVTWTVD